MVIRITKTALVEVRAPLTLPQYEIDKFLIQKQDWIEEAKSKIILRNYEANKKTIITKEQEQKLRKKAKEIIPAKVEYYSKRMKVTPIGVKINSAKTRWGSCSKKNSLNFSWRLMLTSDELIDYAVVHELAHIKEHNHSKRFWKVVEKILPDYKERGKKLKNFKIT
jgi:predicted metal-dependent hydrolase